MKEIVIATRNPGKLEEFKVLMKDLEVELRSLEEWPNVPEPEETGKTFMANARLKAGYYAKETGLPCIADAAADDEISGKTYLPFPLCISRGSS